MAKYRVRVDSSFYGDGGVQDASVVGVAFDVTDTSNGGEELLYEGVWGDVIEVRDSTETELIGIERAVDKALSLSSSERVVVFDVVCDCDSAIESLESGDVGFDVGSRVLERVSSLYSVNWISVNRSEMWDLDDKATRKQRSVRHSSGFGEMKSKA